MTHIMGWLGSGMRVSASFQIISHPVGWLWLGLGSEPHIVGRLVSGPRVGAGRLSLRVFSVGGFSPAGGVVSCGVIS